MTKKVKNKDIIAALDETRDEMVKIEEEIFNLMPTDKSASKWTTEDRILACTYFAVTGSSIKTSNHMAAVGSPVPSSTIRMWKQEAWWKPVMTAVRKGKNDELDSKLTDIIMAGTEQLKDRVENGNVKLDRDGELVRVPLSSAELAKDAIGIPFDKRALVRGDPTQRIEKISTEQWENLFLRYLIPKWLLKGGRKWIA